jgi:phospholipid/cholesterol/gamma-HCH transport system ATP-binding protein
VLVDCSFYLDAGQTLAINGPKGSGKSLILQLLMGFETPDQGTVVAAHLDMSTTDGRKNVSMRERVVMLSQSGAVAEALTVAQNVRIPFHLRQDYDERNKDDVVDGLLAMGNLSEFRDLRPADLPSGQRRMLAFIHALAAQPECVLLDEPTAESDPLQARNLTQMLLRLKHQLKLTMVVATRDLDLTSQLADRVLFLEGGRSVFGTEAEFFASSDPGVQRYLRMDNE